MAWAILYIRLKQLQRSINGIGIFRFVFLIILTGFFIFVLYVFSAKSPASRYISIGFLLMILLLHLRRKDKLFLKVHFPDYKLILLTEYMILVIPFLIVFIIHRQWIALGELAFIFIIPGLEIKTKSKSLNTRLQELIPSDAIEWKAGIKKQFYLIVPLWGLAASTSFFIGSVPVSILILGILSLSLYEHNEPFQVLMAYELNPKRLLWLKVRRQFQLFSILILPLMALFFFFHTDRWYIPVLEYVLFCFLNVYVIMAKYAFYEPNVKSPANEIFNIIGTLGILIPVFLPVVWLLTFRFYSKSMHNLNIYLHDYDK